MKNTTTLILHSIIIGMIAIVLIKYNITELNTAIISVILIYVLQLRYIKAEERQQFKQIVADEKSDILKQAEQMQEEGTEK